MPATHIITKRKSDFIKKKNFLSKHYILRLLECNNTVCPVTDITKSGKILHSDKSYLVNYQYLLYLLNNIHAYSYIKFPLIYGRNERDIIDKLSILHQCKQENVIFYIYDKGVPSSENSSQQIKTHQKEKVVAGVVAIDPSSNDVLEGLYDKERMMEIVFLKHTNIENFTKVYFYNECAKGNVPGFTIDPHNIPEKMKYLYFTYSLLTYEKPKDSDISIKLFYYAYIKMIAPEIMEKYNIDIKDPNMIANYEKLYLLLNKLGYVKKFFQQLYPKCKREAFKIEKKITEHPVYIEYLKYFNSYRPFADKILYDVGQIDVERLVRSRVGDHLDKEWILSEYKRIEENANFGIRI